MLKKTLRLLITLLLLVHIQGIASPKHSMRIALNDLPGIDMLNILIAIERAKIRGVDISINYLQSEGIAAQAVISGLADIGMGTPYAMIEKNDAPIRMFYQMNTLQFHPIVNTNFHKTWEDLDGVTMFSHGEGSGTEAIMNMMAKQHGIEYGAMKYLPGSGVRARAMLKDRITASILDTERRNLLLKDESGRFSVLPMPKIYASDEALYANHAFLKSNRASIQILVEEMLYVWNKINSSPDYVLTARKKYNLLPKLKDEDIDKITSFYTEMVNVNAFPNDGGYEKAFAADIDFYTFSGTLTGDPSQQDINAYWDFTALDSILGQ